MELLVVLFTQGVTGMLILLDLQAVRSSGSLIVAVNSNNHSGMYLVRSVLESAQPNYSISESPTASAYVRPSNNARIALPSRDIATTLIDTFFSHFQVQYPILNQKEFEKTVSNFYEAYDGRSGVSDAASEDVEARFMINMVLAISLMLITGDHEESHALSKSFAANAMADVSLIMQTKNVQSVQCLLLLLLLSILDSSPAPIWYISGLCMRMCIDLGCHSERTITISSSLQENQANVLDEADTKRRLFWITYGFDRTLNILLGRPFTFDNFPVDINLPGCSLAPGNRQQIIHWLELQRLQSEIVHKLHTSRVIINEPQKEETEPELTRWTSEMAGRLKGWNEVAQNLADSGGYNINWWGYWYRTALLILYRPSPLRPNPDTSDTLSCYTVAKDLIQLSFLRISESLAEFTWVDLNFQFISGITLIFIIWKTSSAREKAKDDWVSLKSSFLQWKLILERLGARWERISRAHEALSKLADATIKLVEKDLMRPAGGTLHLQASHDETESRRSQWRSIIQQLHGLSQQTSVQTTDQQGSRIPHLGADTHMGIAQTINSDRGPADQEQTVDNRRELLTRADGEVWTAFDAEPSLTQETWSGPQAVNNTSHDPTEGLWPALDLSDVSSIPEDMDFWTYFSAPMLGVEDMATANFNYGGRPGESSTNSILNFQGDLDLTNLTPQMPIENTEAGDFVGL